MCKFKSAIILKDSVFIPDYDSHSDMLQELGIKDTEENACRLFVRAELIPKNDDCKSDVSTWEYIVDQDILPDWYEAGYDEKRMRDAVQDWAKNRIHIGIDDLVISSGKGHIILDCKVKKICGDAQIRSIQGNSRVDCIYDSANVEYISGSAHVDQIYDSAYVECICGSADVGRICDSAGVGRICDSAHVGRICGSARVDKICGSAHVDLIYGDAHVEYIYGSADVNRISDSAHVECICGSAHVECICDSAYIFTHPNIGWENKKDVVVKDNALLICSEENTIYHSGVWKVVGSK